MVVTRTPVNGDPVEVKERDVSSVANQGGYVRYTPYLPIQLGGIKPFNAFQTGDIFKIECFKIDADTLRVP